MTFSGGDAVALLFRAKERPRSERGGRGIGDFVGSLLKGFGCKVVCRKPGAVAPTAVKREDVGKEDSDITTSTTTTSTAAPPSKREEDNKTHKRPSSLSGGSYRPFPTLENKWSCK